MPPATRKRAAAAAAPKPASRTVTNGTEPEQTPAWEPQGAAAKLAYIQAHVLDVDKTGHNDHQNFDYMQEHGILGVLRGFQRQLRVALSVGEVEGSFVQDGNMSTAQFRARLIDTDLAADHPDREVSEIYTMQATDKQGWGAAKLQTYGKKFALQKFCNIPTEDLPEAEAQAVAHEPANSNQPIRVSNPGKLSSLRKACQDAAKADDKFPGKCAAKLVSLGVDSIDDLTPALVPDFEAWVLQETSKG